MGVNATSRELARNVKALEAVRPGPKRVNYRIKGERGLRLVVHPTGRKVWHAYYQVGSGKGRTERWKEIGQFPDISLAEASVAAAETRSVVAKGFDPKAVALTAMSLDELFARWVEDHAKPHKRSWEADVANYDRHLRASLGNKPVGEITRTMLIDRMNVIGRQAPIMANRIAALVSKVFNFAVDIGAVQHSPAYRLPKIGQERPRERVLSMEELRAFWKSLDGDGASAALRIALKLALVTGQRRGEVMSARLTDLDLDSDAPTWTIPGTVSKNKLMHKVPLTPLAVELFQSAIEVSGGSDHVFKSPKMAGQAMLKSAATKGMARLCDRAGIAPAGPHDLRRTVGTNMARMGIPHADIMRVLNHTKEAKRTTLARHYDLHGYDAEKRAALMRWERELLRIVEHAPSRSNVVALRAV